MNNGKTERIPAPKILLYSHSELPTEEPKTVKYISVDVVKEWIYCNYGAIDFIRKLETFLNSEE